MAMLVSQLRDDHAVAEQHRDSVTACAPSVLMISLVCASIAQMTLACASSAQCSSAWHCAADGGGDGAGDRADRPYWAIDWRLSRRWVLLLVLTSFI